jgi:hypothetical protein
MATNGATTSCRFDRYVQVVVLAPISLTLFRTDSLPCLLFVAVEAALWVAEDSCLAVEDSWVAEDSVRR